MRYRVEQLAASCDVSVDTVRFYQSRGLLPQPEREGRVAWYGDDHAERIRRIRSACSSPYQATRPSRSGCGNSPRDW